MNIAFGALILALLIFPAISFRLAINRSSQLKELVGTISITDSFWAFLFVPIFLHSVALTFIHYVLSRWTGEIRFDILYQLVTGNANLDIPNASVYRFVIQFASYNFACIFLGYLLGYALAKLEDNESDAAIFRYLSLSKLLGLDKNNWYSLLDGKTGSAGEGRSEAEEIDLVYVDILSKAQETPTIYSGFLFKYYFKPNTKELGYLVLQHVMRRDVRRESVSHAQKGGKENINTYSSSMGPAIQIPGEFFIIPAEQILNVNITYLDIDIPV